MTTLDTFPPIPVTLLEKLEGMFPARCPRLTEGDREIWFYAGQRAVVEFLHFKKQEQDAHNPLPLNL